MRPGRIVPAAPHPVKPETPACQARRLTLSDDQARELDRLGAELMFVSEELLKKVAAFEQIYQYATQDRPGSGEGVRTDARADQESRRGVQEAATGCGTSPATGDPRPRGESLAAAIHGTRNHD